MTTAAALALAALATAITGDTYLAVIDYSGLGQAPTFTIADPFGIFDDEALLPSDVEAAIIETVEFYEAVAADPEGFHADTIAEAGRVIAAFEAA